MWPQWCSQDQEDQAMQSLEKIGEKRKLLIDKQHKLLENAMSSTASAAQKRENLRLPNLLKKNKKYALDFLFVEVFVRKTYNSRQWTWYFFVTNLMMLIFLKV